MKPINYQYESACSVRSLLIILALPLIWSCAAKKVANYKVTPNGYTVWRYTKVGEPKKDILSKGDTLVTTVDSIYIIRTYTPQPARPKSNYEKAIDSLNKKP